MIEATSSEFLEIMGEGGEFVPLHTDAWRIEDLSPLWQGADKRGGTGLIIPHAHGRRARPAWLDETDFVLPISIDSLFDSTGEPRTLSARETLEENVAYLQAEIETPPNTAGGVRAARLHMPSGALRGADVVVKRLAFAGLGPAAVRGSLTICVPAGRLVEIEGS